MDFDRSFGAVEVGGDDLVRLALDNVGEHFELAWGESEALRCCAQPRLEPVASRAGPGDGDDVPRGAVHSERQEFEFRAPFGMELHGTPGDRAAWSRVAEHRPEGVSLWFVELPDHGEAPDSNDSLPAYERELDAIIESAPAPVVLVGLSVGAFLAARAAARHVERIERMLLCGGFTGFDADGLNLRRGLAAALRSGQETPASLLPQFLDPLLHPDERDEVAVQIVRRAEHDPAVRFARAMERMLDMGQGDFRIARYQPPTRVLHARGDPLVPLVEGERLAGLGDNAELVVLDAHSHLLPLSHAPEVARHLFA